MPNNSDIIPSADGEFDDFQKTAVSTMQTKATAWGIPAATLTNLVTKQTTWTTAYAKVIKPGQFTSQDVEVKSEARDSLEADLRKALQQWVQKNTVVTDADRLGMGIAPLNKPRGRAAIPDEEPDVKATQGSGHTVVVTVQPLSGKRGKPEDVTRINLRYQVGGTAPVSAKSCPLTKSVASHPRI